MNVDVSIHIETRSMGISSIVQNNYGEVNIALAKKMYGIFFP